MWLWRGWGGFYYLVIQHSIGSLFLTHIRILRFVLPSRLTYLARNGVISSVGQLPSNQNCFFPLERSWLIAYRLFPSRDKVFPCERIEQVNNGKKNGLTQANSLSAFSTCHEIGGNQWVLNAQSFVNLPRNKYVLRSGKWKWTDGLGK